MKADGKVPWDGVERRKRERRHDEVRKCLNCNAYFSTPDMLNICPDCVKKMLMLYKKSNELSMRK
jgi:Zn finger protein HypA/HybF involved in hydrogenase expression